LVGWTVTASHWRIRQLGVIYLLTFLVGAGGFSHCIASCCEILSAAEFGSGTARTHDTGKYLRWRDDCQSGK
jgi:hypothetical protein